MSEKLDRLEQKMDRIEERRDEKLSRIEERLDSIDITLTKQHEQLAHHIYRTSLAEDRLLYIEEDIKPVKKHIVLIESVLKIIGAGAAVVGFLAGLYKTLS